MTPRPLFEHDCTADTYVVTVPGLADVYAQCSGRGYIVRYGNSGAEYTSASTWCLADALEAVARLEQGYQP